jgi:adenylosuccinate lyase
VIDRYTSPAMSRLWGAEKKFAKWLEIEILACEAWSKLGVIPASDVDLIRAQAKFSVARIDELERETNHDVVAFTRCVSESLGPEKKWVHYGLTSTDVVDTALSSLIVEALDLVAEKLGSLRDICAVQARRHKHTLIMGRTHGVHAEPTTFGLKLAVWYAEIERHLERLAAARTTMAVGKLSGAVGTYANIEPFVEEYVCTRLGLTPAKAATQTLQRDRHAFLLSILALVGCSLEKFATEIRALQKTETREVEEPFTAGQKGSSAMPHKRNPIMSERIVGLSRVLRGYALTAMENVALWHERDISHSSAERIIIPDAFHLLYYMLGVQCRILDGLNVYPEQMRANMERSYDLTYSQQVLLKLIESGLSREAAYDLVQRLAMQAWSEGSSFKALVFAEPEITARLDAPTLLHLFDISAHTKHVDTVFARLGL